MIVYVYPSEAHSVRVFVDEVEKKISDAFIILDIKPWNIDIVFSLKEPHIKEPSLNANTYEIRTAEELRWIASQSHRSNTFEGYTIKLINNIDMLSKDFTGIAVTDTNFKFSGTFDGNNYEVKNFDIAIQYAYLGFIGILSSTGVVKNLTVSGTISGSANYTAGIVGKNYGTIENCINNSLVKGSSYTGGIAGLNYKSIKDSINNGLITANDKYTGGIAGANRGSIKDVVNNGTIKAKNDSGLGQIIGGSIKGHTVENATQNGSIEYL